MAVELVKDRWEILLLSILVADYAEKRLNHKGHEEHKEKNTKKK